MQGGIDYPQFIEVLTRADRLNYYDYPSVAR